MSLPDPLPDAGNLLCRCRYVLHPIKEIIRPGLWRDRGDLLSPDWGFWFLVRGTGVVTIDGRPVAVQAGDHLTFRPGQRVRGQVSDPIGANFFSMHWMPLDGHGLSALEITPRYVDPDRSLGPLWIQAFKEEGSFRTTGQPLARHAFFFRLLDRLVRGGAVKVRAGFGQGRDFNGLLDMMDHLSKNLERPFSLMDLAAAFRLDPSSVIRRWQRHLSMTPARWFRERRLEHGRGLLDFGESVVSVARQCGYPDPFTFSKAFKKRYGKSPTGYLRDRTMEG